MEFESDEFFKTYSEILIFFEKNPLSKYIDSKNFQNFTECVINNKTQIESLAGSAAALFGYKMYVYKCLYIFYNSEMKSSISPINDKEFRKELRGLKIKNILK